MIICPKCHTSYPPPASDWFYMNGAYRDSTCKKCRRAYSRQHYQANRDRYIAKATQWNHDNREKHNTNKKHARLKKALAKQGGSSK